MLTHLAAEDSKIFILDPENEYAVLAKKLNGKIIDVGTATQGRMNPFHIITSLSDEEGDADEASAGFSAHLQFLEEFFKQILPGIASEPLEFLNNLLVRMYMDKGIDEFSDFASMKPEEFPTFDDLYDRIMSEYQSYDNEYNKNLLRILLNYISKFSTGGRNSNLWNGPASISTKENFIVFNFQTLLANKNNTIANAQMLLVLKWLDNEIIKNRDYNMKYNAARKVIIVIDEAHVFIDEKFPIALDFMHQLAKRIRKYNGMQIVITQNIKDFVGNEELARKSTAIINACQYSLIFPLAPRDMTDLCKLYENAGAINETEQEEIVNNGRGRAFMITSPSSRSSVNIVATDAMQRMFQ
jgi:type IV secretory pathway VirB4 component